MKNFRPFPVVTLAFLIEGLIPCSSSARGFYPLQVDNLWQYRVTFQGEFEGYYTVEITKDTAMSNGKQYYYYDPAFCGGGFQRIDESLNIYQYDDLFHNLDADSSTDEVLFDKLNSQTGDFWLGYRFSSRRPTYSKNEGYYYTTWFGTNLSVIQIGYYLYDSTSGGPGFFAGRIHYSSKFGIIYVDVEGGASYELRGAKIGGVVYGTIVGVNDKKELIPEQFRVLEPYPNPFNSETNIEYLLPTKGVIDIAIYNVLGRHVRKLPLQEQERGWHRVVWDARDDSGQAVASGVYLVRLQWNGRNQTIHTVYLR